MIERKTVTVSIDVYDNPELNVRIDDVNFPPDEVIVRNATIVSENILPMTLGVWTDLTNGVIFTQSVVATSFDSYNIEVDDGKGGITTQTIDYPTGGVSNQTYELHYQLNRRVIQGSYMFKCRNPFNGMNLNPAEPLTVSFQLEFIKYS